MIVHDQTSLTGQQRRDGFIQYMEENEPDIELLPVQYGGGDQAKSADIAKSILAANPDVVGFYGANEGSAIGVLQGIEESGRTGDIQVIGFDSGKAQIDAIRSGAMAGAITQDPVGMGAELVKAAVAAMDGEELPESIDTGYYCTTRRTSTTRRSRRSCTSESVPDRRGRPLPLIGRRWLARRRAGYDSVVEEVTSTWTIGRASAPRGTCGRRSTACTSATTGSTASSGSSRSSPPTRPAATPPWA
jgi:hypothetical protein